jgi:hypothetical protein
MPDGGFRRIRTLPEDDEDVENRLPDRWRRIFRQSNRFVTAVAARISTVEPGDASAGSGYFDSQTAPC